MCVSSFKFIFREKGAVIVQLSTRSIICLCSTPFVECKTQKSYDEITPSVNLSAENFLFSGKIKLINET